MAGSLHVKTLATLLVLCIREIVGKGTLRMYPFSRVPTGVGILEIEENVWAERMRVQASY